MLERDKNSKGWNARNMQSQNVYIVTARSRVLEGISIRSIIFYTSLHTVTLIFLFVAYSGSLWSICKPIPQMASHNIIPRGEADFDLYPYTPSAGAGYAFLILFAIGGLIHLIMLIPLRSWFFVPFVLGCVGRLPQYFNPSTQCTLLII